MTENFEGARIQLRELEAVWGHPCKQTCTQWRQKLQEHELKREQCDDEEEESNHQEQIESCSGNLWEGDPQSRETPQGGREEFCTQPWQPRTLSSLVE